MTVDAARALNGSGITMVVVGIMIFVFVVFELVFSALMGTQTKTFQIMKRAAPIALPLAVLLFAFGFVVGR